MATRAELGQKDQEPTPKQKAYAINLSRFLMGDPEMKNKKMAALKAGYTEWVARDSHKFLDNAKGVQVALKRLLKEDTVDAAARVLEEGLQAMKIVGRDNLQVVDYLTRHKYAESILKLAGVIKNESGRGKGQTTNILVLSDKVQEIIGE